MDFCIRCGGEAFPVSFEKMKQTSSVVYTLPKSAQRDGYDIRSDVDKKYVPDFLKFLLNDGDESVLTTANASTIHTLCQEFLTVHVLPKVEEFLKSHEDQDGINVGELISRISALEEENRELRQRLDTLEERFVKMEREIESQKVCHSVHTRSIEECKKKCARIDMSVTELESKPVDFERKNREIIEKVKSTMGLFGHKHIEFTGLKSGVGLIGFLRSCDWKFNEKILIEQSSGDPYYMIEYNDKSYGSSNKESKIVFELKEKVRVSGMKMRDSRNNNPRYFSFCKGKLVDGEYQEDGPVEELEDDRTDAKVRSSEPKVYQFKQTHESNCFMIKNGKNWNDKYFFNAKQIEFLSPDHPDGVFRDLFTKYGEKNIRSHVFISCPLDLNSIHLADAGRHICTFASDNEHIRFLLKSDRFAVTGYRIQRASGQMRSWVLRGRNEESDPWTEIDRQKDVPAETEDERFQYFPIDPSKVTGTFRYFELGNDGAECWDGKKRVKLRHFDMFGILIPN